MKLSKLKQASAFAKRFLRPSQQVPIINFDARKGQNFNNQNSDKFRYHYLALAGSSLVAYKIFSEKSKAFAEENEETSQKQQEDKNVLKTLIDSFEIPKLLKQREQEKQKEYEQREEVDVREIEKGVTKEDFQEMKELDRMYGATSSIDLDKEREEYENEKYINDPYTRNKAMKMKHQEYRTIKVGSPDLLKNGQMIQVSVCDPFDDKKFHPTDKVIIAKHNNQYYALGSFCGYDYTNLVTGAFLGEKIICPTCGSTYNVENGYVDQGPSLRNISSFLIQQREEKIQLIIPEHIPAFSAKKFIKRATIDPRTFVILGDSETAIAAVDALRTNYTGRIILVSSSPYGQFENQDLLNRRFSPLDKNDVYLVEQDYFDRANVEVVKGDIANIDLNKMQIIVRGLKEPITFDKMMIAWGSYKKRLSTTTKEQSNQFSNVYYLEDRFSHAKCHNEILKAKSILVIGGTFEAYQTAASVRDYLDSINYHDTEIILMDTQSSEVQQCFGFHIAGEIHQMLKEKRISVLMESEITQIRGINRIDMINFKKKEQKQEDDEYSFNHKKEIEYYIKPDLIIAENGIGAPKHNLKELLAPANNAEAGEPPIQVGIDPQGVPSSDIKFSLHYNDNHSPILAAGSCTSYPSFVHKTKIRTSDIKYNIESGFFAAMNMMDKRVEFRYFPFTPMKIGDTPIYFVGERCQAFHEVIINGSVKDRKFVAYFVYGNEVVGFMTCGFKNLHLYLWEAMKLLAFPPATQLRNETLDYKSIVKKVLTLRPYIKCKREEIIKIPSVMLAEFEHELDKSAELSRKVRANIEQENAIQKKKFQEMKAKYDREGVEFVEDEMDIAQKPSQAKGRASTLSGKRKPGSTSTGEMRLSNNINMGGAEQENQKNPLTMLINTAKKTFNG